MLKIEKRNVTNENDTSLEIFCSWLIAKWQIINQVHGNYKETELSEVKKKKDPLEEIVMRIFMGEIGHQNSDNSQVLNCWRVATEVPV